MPHFWSDPANDGLPTIPQYRFLPEQVERCRRVNCGPGVKGDGVQFRLYLSTAEDDESRLARFGQPTPPGPERVLDKVANDHQMISRAELGLP